MATLIRPVNLRFVAESPDLLSDMEGVHKIEPPDEKLYWQMMEWTSSIRDHALHQAALPLSSGRSGQRGYIKVGILPTSQILLCIGPVQQELEIGIAGDVDWSVG